MDLPRFLEFGQHKIDYTACNSYQQAIYAELVRVYQRMQQTEPGKPDSEMIKTKFNGVIEYLFEKLRTYGGLTPINMYSTQPAIKE